MFTPHTAVEMLSARSLPLHRPGGRCFACARPRGLRTRVTGLAGVLVAALLWTTPLDIARAGEADHEQARRALQAGEVMPLATVLERLARSHPGQVLEVELESSHGRWIYEIRLLQPDGHLAKLAVDARNAEVLRVRGPGAARR